MNRTLVLLILGVIGLAMALLMYNQKSSEQQAKAPSIAQAPSAPQSAPPQNTALPPRSSAPAAPPAAQQASPPRPQAPEVPAQASSSANQTTGQVPGHAQGIPPWAAAMPEGAALPKPVPTPDNPDVSQGSPAPATSAASPATHTATSPAASPATSPAVGKVAPRTIRKITVTGTDTDSLVRILGTDGMQYKTMHLKNPERVVVDLDGAWTVKAPGVPTNKYISNIRIGKQRDKTRIVIDLRQTPENVRFVKQGTDTLDVRIR